MAEPDYDWLPPDAQRHYQRVRHNREAFRYEMVSKLLEQGETMTVERPDGTVDVVKVTSEQRKQLAARFRARAAQLRAASHRRLVPAAHRSYSAPLDHEFGSAASAPCAS